MVISKLSTGSGFGNCLSYCLQTKKDPEVLYSNKCFGNCNDLTKQMNEVAALSNRVEKPVWHASLSFPLCDKIDNRRLIEISQKLEKTLGLEDNQYVVIKHNDTLDHDHIHIVINRVSIKTGKAISTSHNYRKMVKFCRSIEEDYGLKKVLSPRRFLKNEEKSIPRKDERKETLKELVKDAINRCKTYPEFYKHMKSKGYEIEKGRGIAFIDSKKVRIKGSQIGLSLKKIEKVFEQNITQKLELKLTRKRKLRL